MKVVYEKHLPFVSRIEIYESLENGKSARDHMKCVNDTIKLVISVTE